MSEKNSHTIKDFPGMETLSLALKYCKKKLDTSHYLSNKIPHIVACKFCQMDMDFTKYFTITDSSKFVIVTFRDHHILNMSHHTILSIMR